ncbi:hypothetical protein HBN97_10545 [Pseudomonas oryzihabitans]|nr:hypothetical protein [Pseudomonas oryzihabitans]
MRRTRRFFLGVFIGCLCFGIAWVALVAGQLGRPFVNNLWVEGAYAKKLARAASVQAPKLVVVAGSGAMFGIDSPQLEQAFGRPVVNLGVNAGILSPYLLIYARQAVKPGDWVLLPLEYPLYHDRFEVNQVYLEYWLSHPVSYGLNPWRLAKLLAMTPLERVVQGYRGVPPGFQVAGLYGAQHLDERGDQTLSRHAERSPELFAGALHSGVQHYGAQATALSGSWKLWQAFALEVEKAGGCAVFVPPAMLDRPAYHDDPVERAFYEGLPAAARAHGLTYLGRPLEFMYPADDFFDTNYHLTAEARQRHTARLIALLRSSSAHCGFVRAAGG